MLQHPQRTMLLQALNVLYIIILGLSFTYTTGDFQKATSPCIVYILNMRKRLSGWYV